jgi:hypothetical protein
MSEEHVAVNPTLSLTPPGMSGLVKLAPLALPLAIPLALPLLLHAIHGIAVGGIGVMAATLTLGPKGKELVKSSGEALYKMLPGTEKVVAEQKNKDEIIPVIKTEII